MTAHITVPIDDARLHRARKEASARGLTVEAYVARLIETWIAPEQVAAPEGVSSIFGLVQEGEPTDIAKDKDRLIGDAAWQEYLAETKQK